MRYPAWSPAQICLLGDGQPPIVLPSRHIRGDVDVSIGSYSPPSTSTALAGMGNWRSGLGMVVTANLSCRQTAGKRLAQIWHSGPFVLLATGI